MKIMGFTKKYLLVSIALSICLLLTASCTGSPATNGEGSTTYQLEIDLLGTKYKAAVDSQGKIKTSTQVTSTDGRISLSIEEDTVLLDKDGEPLQLIQATIDPSPPPPPEDAYIIGTVCDFGPEGASFNPPPRLTLGYDPDKLPEGLRESDVYIACYENDKWEMLRYKQVDTETCRVTTQIDHLSKYAVLISSKQGTTIPTLANRVDVVYFHRAQRCRSCLYAEEGTRYTLETYFKEELSSGKVTFETVNVQDASNAAIIEEYGAYTSQLFINSVIGNTDHIEHVIEIWDFIGDDEAFSLVVKNKVMEALEQIE